MLDKTLREITERIISEQRKNGSKLTSMEIKLVFHDGKIQKYHFSKKEEFFGERK